MVNESAAYNPLKQDSKHLTLSIEQPQPICQVARALSSPVRVAMMNALNRKGMNVNELAEALALPISTAAAHVRTLEEAGLIAVEILPGAHGSMKLCHRRIDTVAVTLVPPVYDYTSITTIDLPIGSYCMASQVRPSCGLVNSHTLIGEMDNPRSFFLPERNTAQLLWFRHGCLEYRFALLNPQPMHIEWIEVSFEACSEAPGYRDPWKSDIRVYLNDALLGKWISPADFGGRRGHLTPGWWPDLSTQYGLLKTWRVTDSGTFLERTHASDTTLSDVAVQKRDYISLRIEAPLDAELAGGLNLFGEAFGDHPQAIRVRFGYRMHTSDPSK